MSISGISGQASNIQVNIRLLQGGATGAGGHCHPHQDGDGDDGSAGASNSAAGAQGGSTFTSLAQQIQSSVDSAVKNLDPSSSNNPLDVIKTILEALDKALKDNAQGGSDTADPSQTSDATPTADPTNANSAAGASTNPSSGDSATSITPPTAAASPSGQGSLLDSLLSQFNIDPQQFKTDLLSALGGAQNGNVDFSIVFKNFPVGQSINAQA